MLQDAIDSNDKLDKLVNCVIASFHAHFSIATEQLQLIKNGVLGFFFPVVEEYVFKERRKTLVRLDALTVMQLREEFDVQGQDQDGPGGFPEHHFGYLVWVKTEPIA